MISMLRKVVPAAALVLWSVGRIAEGAPGEAVCESAREIPMAYQVDVLVVGGGTGAVSAALAAADSGSRVFLAAPYPYLGDDMTATLRLWLEDGEEPAAALAKAVFDDPYDPYKIIGPSPVRRLPPRPLHVKKTLDQALIDAGIDFLYNCHATDVLVDAGGAPAGIAMANRAGRQAVLARTIIDATDRGTVARLAGARFRPYPAGKYRFRRVVIGGEPVAVEGGEVRMIEPPFFGFCASCNFPARCGTCRLREPVTDPPGPFSTIEYALDLDMPDGSPASFAAAEQAARTLTYHPDQQITSDRLYQVPPDAMYGRATVEGDELPISELPLDAFRPGGLDRVYLLGGAADISRARAERLLRPLELIDLGRRIGAAAADEARGVGPLAGVRLPGSERARKAIVGQVREPLAGVRPVQDLPTIPQAARQLPVLGRYDVVVVGGGTGGAPAGIAAARQGARVLVVEKLHVLGGVGTAGYICRYYWGNRVGFTATVPQGDREALGQTWAWQVEQKAEWWRRSLLDAGAQIWFGAVGCGAVVAGDRVVGAVVSTPYGRGAVLADVVIDATGNADIAAAAGAETDYTDAREFAMQGSGLPPRRLGAWHTNSNFTFTDETDLVDVWHVLVYAKQKYPEAFDQGQLITTRERRRIVGDFSMTVLDQILGRTYPDTICQAYSHFDSHAFTVHPYLKLDKIPYRKGFVVNIPYRCLLPKGLEGILVTGLGISADRDAVPMIRMQADIQNQGYAAGLAAAQAVRSGVPLRGIDIRRLQRELVDIGNLGEAVWNHQDPLPATIEEIAEAVRAALDDYRAAAFVFLHRQAALPLLREALEASRGEQRHEYALLLAMLGDASGAEFLTPWVDAQPQWDRGVDFVGWSQSSALSRLDKAIVALGEAGDRRSVPVILDKLALLDARAEFSHHRAAALALERLGDPAAAAALAELLAKPGMMGHVHGIIHVAQARDAIEARDLQTPSTRRSSLRELLLARALYRVGDHQGLGESILQAYTADLRGHFARHARAVLEQSPEAGNARRAGSGPLE
jgi:flavin-dependent dehydrogenase